MPKRQTSEGIMMISYFLVFLATNIAVVFIANILFPGKIVLGTYHIDLIWALLLSMGTLSIVNTFSIPVVYELERYRGAKYSNLDWIRFFLIINFLSLWVISRVSHQLGLGISSWSVAFLLALALDFVQGASIMWVNKTN